MTSDRRSVADARAEETAPAPSAQPEGVGSNGAWRPSDGPGDRSFAQVGPLTLESGEILEDVTLAYETWGGSLDADGSNAVLVLHALTGDSHVLGEAGPAHPPSLGGGRTSSALGGPSTPIAGS